MSKHSEVSSATPRTRLAVLGSPIAHSQSPALHAAAYAVLGLDWEYGRLDVTDAQLADFVRSRDDQWRGLSLTMPLKREVLPLLDWRDPLVEATGTANTVLFGSLDDLRWTQGFNTDVYGITQAFQRHGHAQLDLVQILGGGATAASAVAASARLGAQRVIVSVRTPERAASLVAVGESCGVDLQIGTLEAAGRLETRPDAVISTLPNGAEHEVSFDDATRHGSVLFDVGYHPWPTALAASWGSGAVIGGLEMLVLQALVQVRIFVNGGPDVPLENEERVLAAMNAAVGL